MTANRRGMKGERRPQSGGIFPSRSPDPESAQARDERSSDTGREWVGWFGPGAGHAEYRSKAEGMRAPVRGRERGARVGRRGAGGGGCGLGTPERREGRHRGRREGHVPPGFCVLAGRPLGRGSRLIRQEKRTTPAGGESGGRHPGAARGGGAGPRLHGRERSVTSMVYPNRPKGKLARHRLRRTAEYVTVSCENTARRRAAPRCGQHLPGVPRGLCAGHRRA
jgi:hypothetical protein